MTFAKWRTHLRITPIGGTTDDLIQLQDSAGNNLFRVDSLGAIYGKTLTTTIPVTITATTYTVAATDAWLIYNNGANGTITLPTAASYPGRALVIKTVTANTVVSAASNVVPLAGGAAGTAILAATAGKYAQLVSDGVNWIITQAN